MHFLIIISVLRLAKSLEEYTLKRYDQYEKSEILEHEDQREILKDMKTIFLPETVIFFEQTAKEIRQKRSNSYSDKVGSKSRQCYDAEEKNLNDINLRNMSDEIVNLNTANMSSSSLPDVKNQSDSENMNANEDKSVLSVNVNISTYDKHFQVASKDERENENCGDIDGKEDQVFWHSKMSKRKIRQLQSKNMQRYMDLDVNPCDDFYGYACGNWIKYFRIPADRSSYDTFEIIRENLDIVLNDLLKNTPGLIPNPSKVDMLQLNYLFGDRTYNNTDDATIKAKQFYASCMDEDMILRRGTQPLISIVNILGGWPLLHKNWSHKQYDLFKLLARLRLLNNDVLISQWIGPDMKNANQYIVHIDQTTLGLPTREYFLDPKNIKYIRAYKILIMGTVKLLSSNFEDIEKDIDDLVAFEISLAEIMASTEERRNISDIYLKTDLSSMTLYFPQYNWELYFKMVLGSKVNLHTPVAVYCVKYLLELVDLLSNTDRRTIQNYLIWRFVRHRLNNLDYRFLEMKQRFNFVLYGRERQPKRWQFCVTQVNTHMGMALGSIFVKQYFDKISKEDTIKMTQQIMISFKNILKASTWLDPHTKQYAKMKIEKMDLKIGFPDFVLNSTELSQRYYDVEIHPELFFENVLNILRHLSRSEQRRLGSEVNRTLWSTSPAVVNAYYSRNKNQIMFPAGILQPPFYHKHFPKALNFGGIGVVIGHEITHGFDDKGRLFDQQGNLMMWWRETSIKNFYKKAQCMIDQYSQYTLPQIKTQVDGYLTQGENIADNGGLKESFRAYESWLRNTPYADERLPGLNLTSKQLFFLNFAQVWCGQQRIEEAKNRMKTSVHSPGIFRIIGVLSNSKDFAREFKCPRNSPMNPQKKCIIW